MYHESRNKLEQNKTNGATVKKLLTGRKVRIILPLPVSYYGCYTDLLIQSDGEKVWIKMFAGGGEGDLAKYVGWGKRILLCFLFEEKIALCEFQGKIRSIIECAVRHSTESVNESAVTSKALVA